MSSYLSIFVRSEDGDKFVNLVSFGSADPVYRALSNRVPYEKITAIDNKLTDAREHLQHEIKSMEEQIADYNDQAEALLRATGDLEERMAMRYDLRESVSEVTEDLRYTRQSLAALDFLWGVADDYKQRVEYEGAPDHPFLYAGIEVGTQITPEMVAI